MVIVHASVIKVANHKHNGISLELSNFAFVTAYVHHHTKSQPHQPKNSQLHQPKNLPTPPAQNPFLPPNSSGQMQKRNDAVPGIFRCTFELVSSLSNPEFQISADCCSVIKVVEEDCMAQAWVPYINLILPLNLKQHCNMA
ncbi:unnamed protein product [Dovyalis caffra]|uniref:Prolamin-like domain-containing protein n=1 Tax=Dovyalis caffra TaxID=77055 RepID=A0AAV1RQB3_9ROSI|nr:unnamed protein product [Dovyalis caffra]